MGRKSGFYWVKFDGEWRVAEFVSDEDSTWSYGGWGLVGKQQYFTDNSFDEIDENIIIKK